MYSEIESSVAKIPLAHFWHSVILCNLWNVYHGNAIMFPFFWHQPEVETCHQQKHFLQAFQLLAQQPALRLGYAALHSQVKEMPPYSGNPWFHPSWFTAVLCTFLHSIHWSNFTVTNVLRWLIQLEVEMLLLFQRLLYVIVNLKQ